MKPKFFKFFILLLVMLFCAVNGATASAQHSVEVSTEIVSVDFSKVKKVNQQNPLICCATAVLNVAPVRAVNKQAYLAWRKKITSENWGEAVAGPFMFLGQLGTPVTMRNDYKPFFKFGAQFKSHEAVSVTPLAYGGNESGIKSLTVELGFEQAKNSEMLRSFYKTLFVDVDKVLIFDLSPLTSEQTTVRFAVVRFNTPNLIAANSQK